MLPRTAGGQLRASAGGCLSRLCSARLWPRKACLWGKTISHHRPGLRVMPMRMRMPCTFVQAIRVLRHNAAYIRVIQTVSGAVPPSPHPSPFPHLLHTRFTLYTSLPFHTSRSPPLPCLPLFRRAELPSGRNGRHGASHRGVLGPHPA